MESTFNRDFLMKIALVIPCAHIPRDLIADRAIKSFVTYLESASAEGKTVNQILFDITGEDKYNV